VHRRFSNLPGPGSNGKRETDNLDRREQSFSLTEKTIKESGIALFVSEPLFCSSVKAFGRNSEKPMFISLLDQIS
jgi:hypothetical protein